MWKLAQSPRVEKVYVAPGNAGTAQIAINLNIKPTDIDSIARAVKEHSIGLTVVGPEAPLAEGIVDYFQKEGLPVFGSTKLATEIESSKVFAKHLMQKYSIPCARSASFSDYSKAVEELHKQTLPVVVKADGLAAGKGVVVATSMKQAEDALASFMKDKALGSAGEKVVIEEYLTGREMSFFALTDGKTVVPLTTACDYKRVFDGDGGPNTGGMGGYSPPYFNTPELTSQIMKTIMKPTVRAMAKEGRPYQGVLYGGLMITSKGPKVLEFNARFGDPETQVILPLLKTDLVDILLAVIDKRLEQIKVEYNNGVCVGVVMASGGYPGNYQTGYPVSGLDKLAQDVVVFHAGTKLDDSGQVVTSGGRVLTVVSTGKNLSEARKKVYDNIPLISFKGSHYRKDIALIRGG